MSKVVWLLWRADALLSALVPQLLARDVTGLQVNVDDSEVAPVQMRMSAGGDPPAAFVHVWSASTAASCFGELDPIIGAFGRRAAYEVEYREPLRNASPAPLGTRTSGYVNVALLRRPERLSPEAWRADWLGRHTQVAIDTQSTRRYVQNVVVRRLTDDGPAIDGIVEELFPPEAMTDLHAMFDAAGDDALLTERLGGMNESVGRFLDVADLTVVPSSEYVFREVV